MDWLTAIIIIIFGLSVGSFLNVVIFRLDKKAGIFWGRSECRECKNVLKWYDLIPILSFLILWGRCRYCKKNISRVYPFVEIITAISFWAYFYFRSFTAGSIYDLVLISALIVLLFFDLLYLLIPDKIIFPLIVLTLVYNFEMPDFESRLATALVLSAIFAIMHIVSRGRWMGLGDAKLVFLIGVVFGYPLGVLSVLLSVWTAALIGVGLIAAKKATLKTALPLGTFLAFSSIVFIIFQNELQRISQIFF